MPSQGAVATLEKTADVATLAVREDGILDGHMPSIDLLPQTEDRTAPATLSDDAEAVLPPTALPLNQSTATAQTFHWPDSKEGVPYEREVFFYLQHYRDIRPSQIESALGIDRFQTVNALRSLQEKGLLQLPTTAPGSASGSPIQSTTPKGEAS